MIMTAIFSIIIVTTITVAVGTQAEAGFDNPSSERA